MDDIILIVVLVAILGGAVAYIVRAKRNGVKCIGCSAGGSCGMAKGNASEGGCGSCSGCKSCTIDREQGQNGCGCGNYPEEK